MRDGRSPAVTTDAYGHAHADLPDAPRRQPTLALLPMAANATMQADAALRDNRHPPIPHYATSPAAETRTTANPEVP